jgi:hypothetical protein
MMSSITFDTMKFVDTLRASGVPEEQAKAEAKAVNEAIASAVDMSLATKSDIQAVSMAVRESAIKTEAEFRNIRLLMSVIAAGVGAVLLKLFFPH